MSLIPTNDIAYDEESYPDIYTAAFEHCWSNQTWFFEISVERNDFLQLCEFVYYCSRSGVRFVGFNNVNYDYRLLHAIITEKLTDPQSIYEVTKAIITSGDPFAYSVWDSDVIVPQIDLFKIHHFDNRARSTSLKIVEFNRRSWSIEDLPFKPGEPVGAHNFPTLRNYNKHDTSETKGFYHDSLDAIRMREELTAKYNKNFINHNDTKIGKDYFIMKLEEAIPGSCYYKDAYGKRQPRQTVRHTIDLSTVVFDYVKFEQAGFNHVLNYFMSQKINNTVGVFHDIDCSVEFTMFADHDLVFAHNINPSCLSGIELDDKIKKRVSSAIHNGRKVKLSELTHTIPHFDITGCGLTMSHLHTIVDGFRYDFGTGGIHGSVSSQIVRADDDHMIIDIDVASYYPNLAIANRLYPEHLSDQFCVIYQDVYNQRKETDKKSPENAMLKLALNGVYGDSNNIYSPFYDPAYTMSITINGQLLLCMLAEQLIKIPDLTMIQINTDGLTVKVPRQHEQHVNSFCKWWENNTLLTLELVEYKAMYIRDVNNYIGEYTDGKLKRKGAYAYNRDDPRELPHHKDHSGLVVQKAAEAALVRGESISQFVTNHSDIMDFMMRAKVPRSSSLVGVRNDVDLPLENTQRYYVTDDPKGVELTKIMPPLKKKPDVWRRIGIDVGWKVQPCNNLNQMTSKINYDYYIQKARKLVDPLVG